MPWLFTHYLCAIIAGIWHLCIWHGVEDGSEDRVSAKRWQRVAEWVFCGAYGVVLGLLSKLFYAPVTTLHWQSAAIEIAVALVLFVCAVVVESRNGAERYRLRRGLLKYALQWLSFVAFFDGIGSLCFIVWYADGLVSVLQLSCWLMGWYATRWLGISLAKSCVYWYKFATTKEPREASKEMKRRRKSKLK